MLMRNERQYVNNGQKVIQNAYSLINEVIMHPSIMWNKHFFYQLQSMPPEELDVIHQWYLEMNEVCLFLINQLFFQKQKFYIREIERANEQLKETAAKLFVKKGFSKEQTDLFLKKVNFMENREYFFHKRN